MDKFIKEDASLILGYQLGDNHINLVCYAYDATIITEIEDDLQRQLYCLYQIA